MVNTYVIAPNFSMAPPPRLRRPDETPELASVHPATTKADAIPNDELADKDKNKDRDKIRDPNEDAPFTDEEPASSQVEADPPVPPTPKVPTPAPAASTPTTIGPFDPLVELQLGDVLTHPFGAELAALNRDCRIAIPPSQLEKMGRQGDFCDTRRRLLSGRLGLWASLLAFLGAGPEVDVSIFAESRSDDTIEVGELQTRRFRVTDEYVKDVLASEKVTEHLLEFPSAELWMVSGMKVARLAKQNVGDSISAGANVGAHDGTTDSDMKLLKLLWKRWNRTTFKTSSNFILAVQLRHIKLVEGKLKVTLSTKNASMADGGAKAREEVAVRVEYAGMDDSLSAAEEKFWNRIDKRKDEDGDELIIPELEGDEEEDEEDDKL